MTDHLVIALISLLVLSGCGARSDSCDQNSVPDSLIRAHDVCQDKLADGAGGDSFDPKDFVAGYESCATVDRKYYLIFEALVDVQVACEIKRDGLVIKKGLQ